MNAYTPSYTVHSFLQRVKKAGYSKEKLMITRLLFFTLFFSVQFQLLVFATCGGIGRRTGRRWWVGPFNTTRL